VLDALTVERFCISDNKVEQLQVDNCPDGFAWQTTTAPETMQIPRQ